MGRREVQDPRRHPVDAGAGAEPAGVPGEPAQADQGRQLPGSAPHHGRGRGGCSGRLRQCDRDRGPLLRRPGHESGGEEHDPGVLLRPADCHRIARPARLERAVPAVQDGRPRCRDDGRGDHLRIRQRRDRRGAEGRFARVRRERQGLFRTAGRQGSRARQAHSGTGRSAARADPPDRHGRRRRGRRSGDRGCVRAPGRQGGGVRTRSSRISPLVHCSARTPRRCRSPVSPRPSHGPRTSSGSTSSARWTRCR